MTNIFDPIRIGRYDVPNRIFMAPMTRARADANGVPGELIAEHYGQRADAGLIIAEATAINRQGHGWPGAPGIYTDAQVAGWAKVTKAVHDRGGRIFLQLFHMGRTVLPSHAGGAQPVAPSAVAAVGEMPDNTGKPTPFAVPRALGQAEIAALIDDFAAAADHAVDAGFDGVEIHAANNFLIDSFLRDGTNKRSDGYGGDVAGRSRFLMETVTAVTDRIGADRVGVRISPTNGVFGISDSDPQATFVDVADGLNRFGLAYLHVLEPLPGKGHPMDAGLDSVAPAIRRVYEGVLIVNGGYDLEAANRAIDEKAGDAVAFGVPYIANPNLVTRLRESTPLAMPNPDTFYTPGPEGYTDYPI